MATDQELLDRAYFIIGAVEDFCPGLPDIALRWQRSRIGLPPSERPDKPAVLTYDDLQNAFVNANYVIQTLLRQLRDINAPAPSEHFMQLFRAHVDFINRMADAIERRVAESCD